MKRLKLNKLKQIFCLGAVLCLVACGLFTMARPAARAHADDAQKITIDSSKFIYNPTFGTFYDNKIYFIDSYGGEYFFKSFDASATGSLYASSSQKLDFEVVNAFAISNYFFILTAENVVYADLSDETHSFTALGDTSFENTYNHIYVSRLEGEFIATLTPKKEAQANAKVIIFDSLNAQTKTYDVADINLDDDNLNVEILAAKRLANGELCYIYFGGNQFKYLCTDDLSDGVINFSNQPNSIPGSTLDYGSQSKIIGVSNIQVENASEDYFLITYQSQTATGTGIYSVIYSYDFSLINNFKFNISTLPAEISTVRGLSPYAQSNGNHIYYPSTDQTGAPMLAYKKLALIGGAINWLDGEILNPQPTNKAFSDAEYQVKTTIKETFLLENPWDITSGIKLEAGTDVLVVGVPEIGGAQVDNLCHCLYTSQNDNLTQKNNYGFVELTSLADKPNVSVSDLKLQAIVKVFSGTSLYKLPSKASTIIQTTDGRFSVEVLDTMKRYKTGEIEWLKVKIGGETGYIDRSKVNFSSDKINFITTNATITQNDTYVFSEASDKSAIIDANHPLQKGKSVYIDGIRDTKTGYTKIKYNDEYGNQFEGYIKTECLKSDNWSQLQIIGTILIAVNTGILILILVFKNKKIGKEKKYKLDHTDDEILN